VHLEDAEPCIQATTTVKEVTDHNSLYCLQSENRKKSKKKNGTDFFLNPTQTTSATLMHFTITHHNLPRAHFAFTLTWLHCISPSLTAPHLIFIPRDSCKPHILDLTHTPSDDPLACISSSFVFVNLTHLPRSILSHLNWYCDHSFLSSLTTSLICIHSPYPASHSVSSLHLALTLTRPPSPVTHLPFTLLTQLPTQSVHFTSPSHSLVLAHHVTHLPFTLLTQLPTQSVHFTSPSHSLVLAHQSLICHSLSSSGLTLSHFTRPRSPVTHCHSLCSSSLQLSHSTSPSHSLVLAHHVTHQPSLSSSGLATSYFTSPHVHSSSLTTSLTSLRSPHLPSHSVTSPHPHSLTHRTNQATFRRS
jgi:hypothetical protein